MSEYDAFAQDFSLSRQRSWPEFEMIKAFLKPSDKLLDLGCGNGRLRKYFDEKLLRKGHYYGFDISEELLSIARGNFSGDYFFRGDFRESLPFGADQFEVVVAMASFHHLLSKKDQIDCLKECFRVMKKGGHLMITTWILPRRYFWSNLLKGRWKNWIIPFGKEKHPRTYRNVSLGELKKLGKKAGFSVQEARVFTGRNNVVIFQK